MIYRCLCHDCDAFELVSDSEAIAETGRDAHYNASGHSITVEAVDDV